MNINYSWNKINQIVRLTLEKCPATFIDLLLTSLICHARTAVSVDFISVMHCGEIVCISTTFKKIYFTSQADTLSSTICCCLFVRLWTPQNKVRSDIYTVHYAAGTPICHPHTCINMCSLACTVFIPLSLFHSHTHLEGFLLCNFVPDKVQSCWLKVTVYQPAVKSRGFTMGLTFVTFLKNQTE